ncbi:unnamed protein product [Dovyalis caffra]|uniref:RING-type E3 ubiquitin transferase n=1 Tax=Dovyalis caffra TaxID=77055 RepID=A0AAV1SSN7_9ROSI|nr:unnamed protein product [Dovyalis caffra]
MTGCCSHQRWLSHSELRRSDSGENNSIVLNLKPYSTSAFKYKKGMASAEALRETECVVCLTGFKDEECVQQLPECMHSFHAPCIDMWLYSHSHCPLCRRPVQRLDSLKDSLTTEENSRDGLLDIRISS